MIIEILLVFIILGLIGLGCFLLVYSSEKRNETNRENQKRINEINETNLQLDGILEQLQALNPPLEKACKQIDKFNHKFLKIK